MAGEYGTYVAVRDIFIGYALAFNEGDPVPLSHVENGVVSLGDVELAPSTPAPASDVFDTRIAAEIADPESATGVALRAASVAAVQDAIDDGDIVAGLSAEQIAGDATVRAALLAPALSSANPFRPDQSVRLAGASNTTYLCVGVDDVAGAIFVQNSANTRIMQGDGIATPSWSGAARTLPTGVTWNNVVRIVRFGAYVYMLAKDTADNLTKVYRATPVARTGDWTDWSAALHAFASVGAAGFGFSLEKSAWGTGTNYLFASEYGDPTGGPRVYRSADGTTWETVYGPEAGIRHAHHVMPDPFNPGHVWGTFGDGGGKSLLRSTASGASGSWTVVQSAAAWQGVQLSFSEDWVFVACDSRQGTVYVVDRATGAPYLAAKNWHRNIPVPFPLKPSRSVTDLATTAASATITSATAAFTSADIGRYVYDGNNFQPDTYISQITNGTTAVLNRTANLTGTGRTLTIAGDTYYDNAYCGAVDPDTGIYYAAAMDTSAGGTTFGLFYLDQPNSRVEILDAGGTNISMNGRVYVASGYLICGQWKRPLLGAAALPIPA